MLSVYDLSCSSLFNGRNRNLFVCTHLHSSRLISFAAQLANGLLAISVIENLHGNFKLCVIAISLGHTEKGMWFELPDRPCFFGKFFQKFTSAAIGSEALRAIC